MANDAREFDVVIWGATGFTGKLVAEYMVKSYFAGKDEMYKRNQAPRLALAGRSEPKLLQLRRELAKIDRSAENLPIIVADSDDSKTLDSMTKRTQVVLSTVGPFMLYGTLLVEYCVRNSTHYCDITGETPWVKSLIDRFHEEAQRKKVMIVPMCGFDSAPADLGTLFMVDHIRNQFHEKPREVHAYVSVKGGVSGGTIASMLNLMENPQPAMRNPFYLCPLAKPEVANPHDKDQFSIYYSKEAKMWSSPFVMAMANTRVVRRSNMLLNYDEKFSYNESMGSSSFISTALTTGGLAAGLGLLSISCTRRCLKRFLPKSGEGPSKAMLENGYFRYFMVAKTDTNRIVKGSVTGGEPGYFETAKMLSEAALSMAMDYERVPGKRGGILTPASAMGQVLIQRLQDAGLKFKIEND